MASHIKRGVEDGWGAEGFQVGAFLFIVVCFFLLALCFVCLWCVLHSLNKIFTVILIWGWPCYLRFEIAASMTICFCAAVVVAALLTCLGLPFAPPLAPVLGTEEGAAWEASLLFAALTLAVGEAAVAIYFGLGEARPRAPPNPAVSAAWLKGWGWGDSRGAGFAAERLPSPQTESGEPLPVSAAAAAAISATSEEAPGWALP